MDRVEQAVESRSGRPRSPCTSSRPWPRNGKRACGRGRAACARCCRDAQHHRAGGGARRPRDHAPRASGRGDDRCRRRCRSSSGLSRRSDQEFGVARVYAHVEPFAPAPQPARASAADSPESTARRTAAVHAVAGGAAGGGRLPAGGAAAGGDLGAGRVPSMTVREAHMLASRVEDAVRDALDAVDDVIVEVSTGATPASPRPSSSRLRRARSRAGSCRPACAGRWCWTGRRTCGSSVPSILVITSPPVRRSGRLRHLRGSCPQPGLGRRGPVGRPGRRSRRSTSG